MPHVPQSNEFILYPNPREVTSLPAGRVRDFVFEQLEIEERTTPDVERAMGLGQLARILKVEDVESVLVAWLDAQPTAARSDVASLFLWGYWPTREPAMDAVLALLRGLDAHVTQAHVRDSLAKALATAFSNSANEDLRWLIRERFQELRARSVTFQPAVNADVERVLSAKLPGDGKKPGS